MKKNIFFLSTITPILFVCFLLSTIFVQAQNKSLSGKIVDHLGSPLTEATVTIKGTKQVTKTNKEGVFTFSNILRPYVALVVTNVGYHSKEVKTAVNQKELVLVMDLLVVQEEEVIVTGVTDKRTAMNSSIAISSLSAVTIQRQVPLSAADLLRNVPGIFVTTAFGEIRNSVYSRGVSGSADGGNGYYYVSMQEDGLPVTSLTFGNWGPDYFLRPDATLNKLEAVRGGTSSILGNNAPGGIFNYISKTGGNTFAGEARAKYGLEGDGHNPFYRADVNIGGPLSKDGSLTYNLGGFYRTAVGAKDAGYAFNKGGQVRGNIVKKYNSGSIKIFGKFLDDHNGFYENTPTTLDFKTAPGFTQQSTISAREFNSPYEFKGETKMFNPANLIHSIDKSIGANFTHNLDSSLTFNNSIKYSSKSAEWNTTTLVSPLAVDNLITYAALGLLGRPGTYTFKDAITGALVGNVTSQSGYDYTASNSNFPNSDIQKNSLFIHPFFVNVNKVKEIMDQASFTKKLKNMSFTLGGFYAHSVVEANSGTAGFGLATMENQPHPVDVTLTNGGQVYQLTNPAHVFQQGGSGFTEKKATQTQFALFAGNNWQIASKLNLDYGARFESIRSKGSAGTSVANPNSRNTAYGGADNNPLTVYDNYGGSAGPSYDFNKTVNTFSYSAGMNYQLSSRLSFYGRYSAGRKAPDLSIYFAANTPFTSQNINPIAQKINQAEMGIKISSKNFSLFVTPFSTTVTNIPNVQLFVNADNTTNYSPEVQYNANRTVGIELESKIDLSEKFSVKAVATFQSAKQTKNLFWDPRKNGSADDTLINRSGTSQPGTILNITPQYTSGKFYTYLSWQYLNRRSQYNNLFYVPAYSLFNLGAGYDITKRLQVSLNVNNLLNSYGLTGLGRPGDFFTLLTGGEYSPAQYEQDKKNNRIGSAVGIQARAYYVSIAYKF